MSNFHEKQEPVPGTNNYLALLNHHPRDDYISFEEGPHIYTVMGERGTYTSVTTWNHSHFSHFDSESVAENIIKSSRMSDPTYKYYGKTKEEIINGWTNSGKSASGLGTIMHYDIECFYNGMDVKNDSIEFTYFHQFAEDYKHLRPYRTEWLVYNEDWMISGSIDMVFENSDGTLQIFDWKRSKEMKYEVEFGKYALTDCISHLPDVNFWHYSLQLNMYRRILEAKYDKKVTKLTLVGIHPDNIYKKYECFEVPIMKKEMDDLIELRLSQVREIKSKSNK